MDSFLFLLKLCFLLVVAVYAQENIVEIEFRRISDSRPDKPQMVTELLVDYLSNDTFEIMCKLNNVTHLNTLAFLILWQSGGPFKIKLQNDNTSVTETYRKPTFYSNVTRWTAAGHFDNVTSNSRNTTLGVSRSVSSFACTDTRMYKCYVQYINYAMKQDFGIIDKQLKVQVTPSKITKQIFDASGDGETIISDLTNSTTIVHVGQKLRLQCTANIGSFNSSVNIVWMRSSLDNGSQLVPFTSGKQIVGEPKSFNSCEFEQNDSVLYNVSQDDALTSGTRFYVQCYVHITSTDWKTPEQHRPNFSFVVHMNDGNETKAVELTVISAIIGGVCSLVIFGVAGIFLKRKFSHPRLPKADEKSEETSPLDETNTSFPLARLYETPAEIDEIDNIQRQLCDIPKYI